MLFYHWGLRDELPMAELIHFTALAERLTKREDVGRALARHDSPLLRLRA